MRIEYHRTLIADRVRTEALFQALKYLIIKGETIVADIGTGTGLLALMALKLGAREVHLYETSQEMAQLAQTILKKNKARNYFLYPCRSIEMIDPPKVDLIISETLGNYALEENIISTLNDARKRMLKSGGRLIPSHLKQYASPVISPRIAHELKVWTRTGMEFDLSPALKKSMNNIYVRKIGTHEINDKNGDLKVWDEVDFSRSQKEARAGKITWRFKKSISIYGFAYWWDAQLTPNIKISTSPFAKPTHWEQLYFPLENELNIRQGDHVQFKIESETSIAGGTHLRWTTTHIGQDYKTKSRQILDLNKGWIP